MDHTELKAHQRTLSWLEAAEAARDADSRFIHRLPEWARASYPVVGVTA